MSDHPATSTFGDLDDPLPDPTVKEVSRHGVTDTTSNSRCTWRQRTLLSAVSSGIVVVAPRLLSPLRRPEVSFVQRSRRKTRPSGCLVMCNDYYVGLCILGNASAMSGNFLARDLEGTAEIVYALLDANLDSADQAMRRALAWSVNPTAVVAWLRENDFNTRSHMLLLMRRGHTQRVALARAMDTMRVDCEPLPPVCVFSGLGGGRAPRSPRRQRQRVPGATPKSAARRSRSRPKTIMQEPRRSSPESRRVQTVTQIKGEMHIYLHTFQ